MDDSRPELVVLLRRHFGVASELGLNLVAEEQVLVAQTGQKVRLGQLESCALRRWLCEDK